MLSPIGMALDTVLEVGDAFLTMLGCNAGGIMLVASVTSIGGQAVGVTKGALIIRTFMIHGEGVRTVIRSRFPGAG